MIITRVIGGLGNQLFQYAVGRQLAEILGVELKLDVSGFKTYKLRAYSLDSFNIKQNLASPEEIARLTVRSLISRALLRLKGKKAGLLKTHIVEKKQFRFDPEVLMQPDGGYLDGYWQTEKYFKNIEGLVREVCTLRNAPAGKDLEIAAQMASCESVSLHIRRGDYVSNPQVYQACGVCPLSYYTAAVDEVSKSVRAPHFFIFSDDIEWCKKNLSIPFPVTFVGHNGPDKDYEDLRLISLCRHQIIANSSFSWWGAWLNPNPQKKVIAPKQWFKDRDTRDLIPEGWLRL